MNLAKVLHHLRTEIAVGKHLHECFASPDVRREGWKRMMAAKRIARRLNLKHI